MKNGLLCVELHDEVPETQNQESWRFMTRNSVFRPFNTYGIYLLSLWTASTVTINDVRP